MPKVTVEKIRITIGRKTLELTPEELNELRDVLDDIFGKTVIERRTVIGSQIVPRPNIIEEPVWPRWPYRKWDEPIWYGTGGKDTAGRTLQLTCGNKTHDDARGTYTG